MRLVLKGCPRCGGDLIPEATEHGEPTFLCLQCGRYTAHPRARRAADVRKAVEARPASEPVSARGGRTAA
jgi:hypothetical protein